MWRGVLVGALTALAALGVAQAPSGWQPLTVIDGEEHQIAWNAPGESLTVEVTSRSHGAAVRFTGGRTGLLGLRRRQWRVVEIPISKRDLSVDIRRINADSIAIRAVERQPSCGTLCDDPSAMADMLRAPLYRGYWLVTWRGAPSVYRTWTTTDQSAPQPDWVVWLETP